MLPLLALAACAGPRLEQLNDRGGSVLYHSTNATTADAAKLADQYCSFRGRKAKLGTPSMDPVTYLMSMGFDCVDPAQL